MSVGSRGSSLGQARRAVVRRALASGGRGPLFAVAVCPFAYGLSPAAQGDPLLLPSGKVKGSGVSPSWGRLLFPLSPAARFQSPSGMVYGP